MNPERALVLFVVEQMVHNKRTKEVEDLCFKDIDWSRFKEIITYHDLTPFAYSLLKDFDSSLPQDLMEFLKNNYYCALVRCQSLWQEFLRISGAFKESNITLLPIKGMALLHDLYMDKPIRPMTDIDILVKEDDIKKAEAIFSDIGYRKELYDLREEYWRENQCHIAFYKKEKEGLPFVELHWGIDFKRENRTILPELWGRTRCIDVDGKRIDLLSPEDTLFSLALHNRRFGRTLCLKNAYDVMLLLNKYSNNFDWDYCLDMNRKYRLCASLFFILYQAKFLLETNIPGNIMKKLNVPNWKKRMIRYFIEKNTFSLDLTKKGKDLYLKNHFLLYDSFWEPIKYILDIPREQFAKFYGLEAYNKKTDFLYKMRLMYMPLKCITGKSYRKYTDLVFNAK
ncbi:nucleotidyltransferase family protein [Candidatus Omnitrophota bacterium]